MRVPEFRNRARELGVKNYSRKTKAELIWSIQTAEGNTDCFGKISDCGQKDCLWFEDCQALSGSLAPTQ